jgi:hypothetical protein
MRQVQNRTVVLAEECWQIDGVFVINDGITNVIAVVITDVIADVVAVVIPFAK